jgi:hypothetical protein
MVMRAPNSDLKVVFRSGRCRRSRSISEAAVAPGADHHARQSRECLKPKIGMPQPVDNRHVIADDNKV